MILLAQWNIQEWCAVIVPAMAILGGLAHLVKIGTEIRADVRSLKDDRTKQETHNDWATTHINGHEIRLTRLETREA